MSNNATHFLSNDESEEYIQSSIEINTYDGTNVTSVDVLTKAASPPKISVFDIPWTCRATQATIRFDLVLPGEPLAFDAEFQTYRDAGQEKFKHRLCRFALVNTLGQVVVDFYVCYPQKAGTIKRCPPKRFMVEPPDLLIKNGAVPGHKAEAQLKRLMKDRPIVVHDKRGETTTLFFEDCKDAFSASNGVKLYDTQELYSHLQSDGTPALSTVYQLTTGKAIQKGDIHIPVEDSQATMELFKLKYPYDRAAEKNKVDAKAEARPARLRTRGDSSGLHQGQANQTQGQGS